MTPYISATVVPPTERLPQDAVLNIGVDLTLLTPDNTKCGYVRGIDVAMKEIQQPVTGLLNGPAIDGPGQVDKCKEDGIRILQVERIGEAWTDQALPVELIVRREPPTDASAVPPPASAGPALPSPTHGTASAIDGGNSFNEAPELVSGATYSDSLATGENRYYRVPVQWGQRLSYLVTPTGHASPVLQGSAYARVEVANPVRDVVTPLSIGQPWFVSGSQEIAGSTPYPARYTNRDIVESSKYSLDGDYYVRLSANVSSLDDASVQDFLITVVVSGDVEPGPVYRPDAGDTAQSAGASSSAGTIGPVSTGSVSAVTVSSAQPNVGAATTVSSDQAAASDPGTAGRYWIYLIAALVIVAAIALTLVLRRNRSTDLPTGPPHS